MLRTKRLMIVLLTISASAAGEAITVPNFSFELPPVVRDEQNPFGALPFLDDWDETAVGLADEFDQNTGVFLNTDPQSPDHITNPHLDRLAFVSSLVGNDLRQALTSNFAYGLSYQFTVAVGTSLTFPVGLTEELEVALFYFNGGVEQIIGSTFVSGSEVNATSLIDVTVSIPAVLQNNAWVNQPIGVLVRPVVDDPNDADGEGFWNVDHARLEAIDAQLPALSTMGLGAASILLVAMGMLVIRRRVTSAATS